MSDDQDGHRGILSQAVRSDKKADHDVKPSHLKESWSPPRWTPQKEAQQRESRKLTPSKQGRATAVASYPNTANFSPEDRNEMMASGHIVDPADPDAPVLLSERPSGHAQGSWGGDSWPPGDWPVAPHHAGCEPDCLADVSDASLPTAPGLHELAKPVGKMGDQQVFNHLFCCPPGHHGEVLGEGFTEAYSKLKQRPWVKSGQELPAVPEHMLGSAHASASSLEHGMSQAFDGAKAEAVLGFPVSETSRAEKRARPYRKAKTRTSKVKKTMK